MTTTPDAAQVRADLVTCTRLLALCDILDYSGHCSARVPGTDLVYVQPRDCSRSALTADDLLVVDLEGRVVEGGSVPPAEIELHLGVYRARGDVQVVCHGHPTLSTTFSMTDRPLLPMRHFAYKHADGLPVHPDVRHIVTAEQGDAVAKTLGSGGACLLRSHGTVVVSTRFDELFMDCLDIEENARTLLYAGQLGGEVHPLTGEEIDQLEHSYGRLGHRPAKMWQHYVYLGQRAGVL